MFKALAALAAVTVCCLGNDYPAQADNYDYMDRIINRQIQRIEQQRQEHRLREIVREEINAAQFGSQW